MRNTCHRILNLALYVSFCFMAGTGILLAWRLPPGSRGGRGLSVLGLGRHDWGDIHFWVACFFLAAIVAHLVMNWTWLKKIAAGARPWRLWAGLLAGLAIIAFFFFLPVESHPGGGHQNPGAHGEASE